MATRFLRRPLIVYAMRWQGLASLDDPAFHEFIAAHDAIGQWVNGEPELSVMTDDGAGAHVPPGDWIVTVDGRTKVVPDAEFQRDYVLVGSEPEVTNRLFQCDQCRRFVWISSAWSELPCEIDGHGAGCGILREIEPDGFTAATLSAGSTLTYDAEGNGGH